VCLQGIETFKQSVKVPGLHANAVSVFFPYCRDAQTRPVYMELKVKLEPDN